MSSALAIQNLVDETQHLISPPKVYMKLKVALDDPSTDFDDLAQLISTDVSIAARLLKIANSAMFNFPGQINSIDRALSLIGTQQTVDLVLGTEILKSFNGVKNDIISVEDFTKHSLGCAISSRVLAQYKREHDVEAHFVNGLLHDTGRLLLFVKYPEIQKTLLETNMAEGIPLSNLETQQYGISHDKLGAHLFETWGLPDEVIESTAHHHDPLSSTNHSYSAAFVHVADWITHSIPMGFNGENFVPELDEGAWLSLGIPESALEMIMTEIIKQFTSTVRLLL
ncbi:MAG: HDOD domain-containing protein [Pseudomonadales bacterium]|nr:HDOD domain-containing protein [Pseudomonadales bacterium]